MDKKRFIFDLDGTLLSCDYKRMEEDFFYLLFGEDGIDLVDNIGQLLTDYEKSHVYYNIGALADYLSKHTNLDFTSQVINEWINIIPTVPDFLEEGIIDTLEYLKMSGYSLVVLTNWFGESQIPRLQNAGIIDYFDYIVSGDLKLKPHSGAYLKAMGDYYPEECVMIGDGLLNDYIGPRSMGIESILYDKDDIHHKNIVKVKRINEMINKIKM